MVASDQPESRDALSRALERLVEDLEPGVTAVEVDRLEPLGGGNARRAWAVDLGWDQRGRRHREACVMLVQEEAGQLESDLALEFRVLSALRGSEVPAPTPMWLDAAGDRIGAPALVMKRLPGVADLRGLLQTEHRARNRNIALAMARAAAALHRVPVRGQELGPIPDPGSVALRQLEGWERLFRAHRMEPHPIFAAAFDWLRAHLPTADRVAIVHGDFRFGNLLYADDQLCGVLDWEMAHLGDPCEDLAWMYHPLWSPAESLDFADFVAAYEEVAGLHLSRDTLHFYRLFTEVKHAVISLTGAHAFASGRSPHLRLADRMTWVPECLVEFRRLLRDGPLAGAGR